MRTSVKNSFQFLSRGIPGPIAAQNTIVQGRVFVIELFAAQIAQLGAMGIISEASRHQKDVPLVVDFGG